MVGSASTNEKLSLGGGHLQVLLPWENPKAQGTPSDTSAVVDAVSRMAANRGNGSGSSSTLWSTHMGTWFCGVKGKKLAALS